MKGIFLNNLGDLAQIQRVSFLHFLYYGVSEELRNFPNYLNCNLYYPTREKDYRYNTDLTFYRDEPRYLGPRKTLENVLLNQETYALELYVPISYYYILNKESDWALFSNNIEIEPDSLTERDLLKNEEKTFKKSRFKKEKKTKEETIKIAAQKNSKNKALELKPANELTFEEALKELEEFHLEKQMRSEKKAFQLYETSEDTFESLLNSGIYIQKSQKYFGTICRNLISEWKLKKSLNLQNQQVQVTDTIFFGEIPLMTEEGSFFINGVERIVVSQMIRRPGVYFQKEIDSFKRIIYTATIISNKNSWSRIILDRHLYDTEKRSQLKREAEINKNSVSRMYLVVPEHKPFKLSSSASFTEQVDSTLPFIHIPELVKSLGLTPAEFNEQLKYPSLYYILEQEPRIPLKKKLVYSKEEHKKARYQHIKYFRQLFRRQRNKFDDLPHRRREKWVVKVKKEYFSIGEAGREQVNRQFGLRLPSQCTYLTPIDVVEIINGLLELKYFDRLGDDIDHQKNKQIRPVGDLLRLQFRNGIYSLRQIFSEATPRSKSIFASKIYSPKEAEVYTDQISRSIFDTKIISNSFRDFFLTGELAQYMDQTNPLAEITQARRVTVFGPNGLQRDHVSDMIRDLHPSQYGRLCPVETPEGHNAGLVTTLSLYSHYATFGWLEAPYFFIQSKRVERKQEPWYLNPDRESETLVAFSDFSLSSLDEIPFPYLSVKKDEAFALQKTEKIQFITPSPLQLLSLATSLVPFVEHNDANRALMGANMQRQAISLILPQKPIVGTGFEAQLLLDSQFVIKSYHQGRVSSATSALITIKDFENQKIHYKIRKYQRSNQYTSINERPLVWEGEEVFSNQIIADGASTLDGELALGRNLTIAYMPWEGYNYEDAIVLSETIVANDYLTSIHLEDYEISVDFTSFSLEKLTRDIRSVSDYQKRNLDQNGIVRIGAYVKENDILIGKVVLTKDVESTLKPFLRFFKNFKDRFKEKSPNTFTENIPYQEHSNAERNSKKNEASKKDHRNPEKGTWQDVINEFRDSIDEQKTYDNDGIKIYRDQSLRLPPGVQGRVIDIRLFTHDTHDTKKLDSQALTQVSKGFSNHSQTLKVTVAEVRKLEVGDKIAGRHGNKGIVSRILAQEDMPILPDGTPVDILFNPLGVPSRMNVGQLYECLLGFAGAHLNKRFKVTPFDEIYGLEASRILIHQKLKEASIKTRKNWLYDPILPGRLLLKDGRTGDFFDNPILIGKAYILKLIHLVEDKVHARSTGPYSTITEQPLAGKSQNGGQRFGEMEVWALEAFGASYNLQELLTIKSDDIDGRKDIYPLIGSKKEWWPPRSPKMSLPETFLTLYRELNSLGLDLSPETGQVLTSGTPLNAKNILKQRNFFAETEKRLKLKGLKMFQKSDKLTLLDSLTKEAQFALFELLRLRYDEILERSNYLLKIDQEYIQKRDVERET
ncbi:MAG: hypothetical protein EOP00_00480 [Pedobacter sp.]|nr:MAG: hypothetical protein EOP00_00480 [Pedobacter sp.]